MVFRKFLGMIMSVSTLTIGSGAATPRSVVNFSMALPSRNAGINGLLPVSSSRPKGPASADLDHQRVGDHVVQAAFPVGEGDHQEADAQDDRRQDLGEVAAGGVHEAQPLEVA